MSEGQCQANKPCPAILQIRTEVTREVGSVRESLTEVQALTGQDIKHLTNELRDLRAALTSLPKIMADTMERETERMADRLKRGEGKFDELFRETADHGARLSAVEESLKAGKERFERIDDKLTRLSGQMGKIRRWMQALAIVLMLLALGKAGVWLWPAIEKLWGLLP